MILVLRDVMVFISWCRLVRSFSLMILLLVVVVMLIMLWL